MIRVAVVDDHHAIRVGLEAAIASQPGITCVGTVADGEQLAALLYRARPDVLVLDYHLPRTDGLRLCRQIKRDVLAPAVVLYSAYADASLAVSRIVAGADALVDKAAPARELFEAIRCVATGGSCMPPPIPELLARARGALDAEDQPIFDRLIEGAARADIASTLGLARAALEHRIDIMLERLPISVAVEAAHVQAWSETSPRA
jgi:DNA-binding NarL/FixJ family response regulator